MSNDTRNTLTLTLAGGGPGQGESLDLPAGNYRADFCGESDGASVTIQGYRGAHWSPLPVSLQQNSTSMTVHSLPHTLYFRTAEPHRVRLAAGVENRRRVRSLVVVATLIRLD